MENSVLDVKAQACDSSKSPKTHSDIPDDSGLESNLSSLSTPVAEGSRTPGDKNDEENAETIYHIRVIIPNADPMEIQIGGSDMVQELYHVILEREQTCQRTCFKVYYDGKALDHFVEIRNIANIKPRSVFYVVEEPYNTREARLHVRHLRDILRCVDPTDALNGLEFSSLSCYTSVIQSEEPKFVRSQEAKSDQNCLPPDYLLPGVKDTHLETMVLLPSEQKLQALKNFGFSGFNPPSGPRKLKGDVLYLFVDTCEGRRFHITCCTRGFFVNSSTDECFDSQPSSAYCRGVVYHSLFELLSVLSPQFRKVLTQLLKVRAERSVYERLPTPFQTYSWIVPKVMKENESCSVDQIRADDLTQPHRIGLEDLVPGQIRDWNEELQSTHDMTRTTFGERLCRDRAKFKVYADFLAASVRGAMNIVEGSVPAINAIEDPKTHMFIWNNIFFSLGFDVKDHYKNMGGDAASFAAATTDLNAVRAYSTIDSPKLHTLGMAIVDYRGLRLTAQSIIPGILEREQEESVVYGSYDSGKTVAGSTTYNEYLEKPAKLLRIAPHKVWSGKAENDYITLYSSYESKGIIGNDGRHYLLDLLRTFPPDVNFLVSEDSKEEKDAQFATFPRRFSHKLVTLRQELIDAFVENRYACIMRLTTSLVQRSCQENSNKIDGCEGDKAIREKIIEILKGSNVEEIWKQLKALETATVDDSTKSSDAVVEANDEEAKSKSEKVEKALSDFTNVLNSLSSCELDIRFNPDCFCEVIKHAPEENLEEQRRLVKAAASFILDEQIPAFVRACTTQSIVPIDGRGLVESMHARGINMRYLGSLINAAGDSPRLDYVLTILKLELLCRCARHIFQTYLQKVDSLYSAAAIAHFLNCFTGFGTSATGPLPPKPSMLSHFDSLDSGATKKNNKKKRKPLGNASTTINQDASNGKDSPSEEIKSKEPRSTHNSGLEWRSLSQRSLWTALAVDSWEHYGVKLGSQNVCESFDQFIVWSGAQRVSVTRRFCQLVGVQLFSNNYSWDSNKKTSTVTTLFSESDIHNIMPVVKHVNLRSQDAYNLYMSALTRMQQGFPRLGYELMSQAHNMMNNVYGPLHPDLALCLRFLARMAFVLGDTADALSQQQKAVMISERCNGIDNFETVFDYINAAHYSFANIQIGSALKLAYRARYLLLILHGENHLIMGQIDANIGIMLYAIQEYESALKFLQSALQLFLKYDTAFCLKTAVLYHVLACIHSSRGDFRTALQMEKETFNIYSKLFGDEHEKTRSSSECLNQLTKQAVNFQKKMNDVRGNSGALVHLIPMNIQPSTLQSIIEMLNLFNNFIFLKLDTNAIAAAKASKESDIDGKDNSDTVIVQAKEAANSVQVAEEALD